MHKLSADYFWSRRNRHWLTALLCVAFVPLAAICHAQSVVSVIALGAHPDGANPAATTAAFQRAFRDCPNGEIVVPAGSYAIDNSNGPLTITGFNGRLRFQGTAQLVFTNNLNGGLLFEGGMGAVISGLRATYAEAPKIRNSPNEEIKFSRTINTVLTDAVVQNSPAAGILFYGSVNPMVTGATVLDSKADGLNFSNCQNARVVNLRTQNTGDDGLAFVNYARYPDLVGGSAHNITIVDSKARGIAIAGQSAVTVDGFEIHNTASSGVLVAQDTANGTRIPANVRAENGSVYNAGILEPMVGNQYGIEFNASVSATFPNIKVFGSQSNGLSGTSPEGVVTVRNVVIDSPRTGLGFLFYRTGSVLVTDSSVVSAPSYGFLTLESRRVAVRGLIVTNSGANDPLKPAVWFENALAIDASGLQVAFDPGMAHIVGCHTDSGHPAASGLVKVARVGRGTDMSVTVQNSCPQVTFRGP